MFYCDEILKIFFINEWISIVDTKIFFKVCYRKKKCLEELRTHEKSKNR